MTTIGVRVMTALEELASRNEGQLHPEDVVKAARPERSPLHHLFEWDDTEAARLYRIDQARELIRSVHLTIETSPDQSIDVRRYVHVPDPERPYYALTSEALGDDRRTLVLDQARRELEALRRKYEALIDFAAFLDAEAKRARRKAA